MAYAYGLAPIVRHRKRRMTKGIVREDGPFLLWSHYHGAWHCSSEPGTASGYTNDLRRAGVFSYDVASLYHSLDTFPVRDEAVPLSRAKTQIEQLREVTLAELARCDRMLSCIQTPKPKDRPRKP